ncbi:MAG: hypothetical protein K0R48_159 [Gammaproteobacteria bacterium]|nr:hypothetical protein [Gammaproteobacteria bacterium]
MGKHYISREVNVIPITDKSLQLVPTQDVEIQKLINILPPENHPTGQRRYIITGGPGAGKTTIINELSKEYTVIPEAATTIIEKEIAEGIIRPWQFDDYHIKVNQLNNINQVKVQNLSVPIVFFDRGFLDSLSYILLQKRILHQYVIDCVQTVVNASYYEKDLFFIDNLEYVMPGPARNESLEESLQKAACLEKNYRALGYNIIHVPPGPVEDRVAFIVAWIKLRNQLK